MCFHVPIFTDGLPRGSRNLRAHNLSHSALADTHSRKTHLATEQQLSDFLESVEKRAFRRAAWQVRDDDEALDIVQCSMLKLIEHYADRPASELPLLFQRILANQMMDWFRRRKTREAHLVNAGDFMSGSSNDDEEGGGPDALEVLLAIAGAEAAAESAEQTHSRKQVLRMIETAVQALPARQRQAFLLRYWEELDVVETAAVMGCSTGSVKTHCARATQALARMLQLQGISP